MPQKKSFQFPTSERLATVGMSPILAAVNKVSELRAAGHEIFSLTAGEPDFDTPPHILEAATRAMHDGQTHYTAVAGTPELRGAIRRKFERDNQLTFADDEVIASAGSKQVIAHAFGASLDSGDEVLVPAPYWAAYPDMVRVHGGLPVFIHTTQQQGYKITPTALQRSITAKTRWLVINSPSNPSGAVYSADELSALGEVLREYPRVAIISDDIYEHIRFTDQPYATMAVVCPDLADRVLTINGVSKAFAMTGWRVGYAGGGASIIKPMCVMQSQSSLAPCSIAQAATIAALDGPTEPVEAMVEQYRRRAELVKKLTSEFPQISIGNPDGAFYVLIDLEKVFARTHRFDNGAEPKDVQFATWLLEESKVAVVPGSAFGAQHSVRVSFATDEQTINVGLTRLLEAAASL